MATKRIAKDRPSSRFGQRNQAVERALQVLELLSAGVPSLSLQAISERMCLHPSTTHRLLKTLEEQHYLSRADGAENYRLGPKVLTLAARMLNSLPVRDIAAPHIRRLSEELGETVALAAYDGGFSVYLDCAEGPSPVGVFLRPGGQSPAPCVASGLVQLAFQPAAEVERLLLRGPVPCVNGSGGSADELLERLQAIRALGYVLDDNLVPGLRAAAAPVRDATGYAVAAITVVGLAYRLPMERLATMARPLCRTADAVSASLGYSA